MDAQRFATLPNNQQMAYTIENQSSPIQQAIVLIHGNFSALPWWRETIAGLKHTNRKIIAMDLRGFGKSTYKNQCARFGDWAADVVQLLKVLNIRKAVLVGWSFGGAVSMKAAELAPELVTKLVLTCSVSPIGVPLLDQNGQECRTLQKLMQLPKVAGSLYLLNTKNYEGMRKVYDAVIFTKMAHVPEARKVEFLQAPFQQRCYPQVMLALNNSDIEPAKIKAQVLFIHGAEDPVIPPQMIVTGSAQLGKLDLWDGHAHMIPVEDTPRYVATIKNFLQ